MYASILSFGFFLGNLLVNSVSFLETDSIQEQNELTLKSDLYTPPAFSADAKSLRMVNLHSAVGLPKGDMELFIQHRFGTVNSGAYNLYGIDQSFMRIGLDYGLSNALTVGISRSSFNTLADAYVKWQMVGNKKTEKSVKLAWMSNVTSDIRTRKNFTQEPYYYSNRLRFVNQWIVTKNLSNSLVLGFTPSFIHINLVDKKTDPNDIAVIAGFARLKISDKYSFTFETGTPIQLPELFPKNVATSVNIPQHPYMSMGLDLYTARHVFHISVSNAGSMNEGFLLLSDNGNFAENLRLGFNIVRRW